MPDVPLRHRRRIGSDADSRGGAREHAELSVRPRRRDPEGISRAAAAPRATPAGRCRRAGCVGRG
jgi:hypothetical protein